jgi:hypothetical protein
MLVLLALIVSQLGCSDAVLSGLSQKTTLLRVDKDLSTIVEVGANSDYSREGLSAVDAGRRILYYLSVTQPDAGSAVLVSMSMDTGVALNRTTLPLLPAFYTGPADAIVVEPASGDVLVVGTDIVDQDKHTFVRVSFGAITAKFQLNGAFAPTLAPASTFDDANSVIYLKLGSNVTGKVQDTLVGVNVDTQEVFQIAEAAAGGHNMQTLQYHAETAAIIGHGLSQVNSSWVRTLVSLDVKSRGFRVIGVVDGWLVEAGAVTALCGGVHFSIVQRIGATGTAGFHLIAVDIASAGLLHSSAASCGAAGPTNTSAACPSALNCARAGPADAS